MAAATCFFFFGGGGVGWSLLVPPWFRIFLSVCIETESWRTGLATNSPSSDPATACRPCWKGLPGHPPPASPSANKQPLRWLNGSQLLLEGQLYNSHGDGHAKVWPQDGKFDGQRAGELQHFRAGPCRQNFSDSVISCSHNELNPCT